MLKQLFLYGELEEEIFMEIPLGVHVENGKVCKLNKSLYGLKQASRCWNAKFTNFLKSYGFTQTESDHCVFTSYINNVKVTIIIYVDDGLIFCSNQEILNLVIEALKTNFCVRILDLNYFVGLEIVKSEYAIRITQKRYVEQIIQRFNMSDAHSCSTPVDPNVSLTNCNNDGETVNFPFREAVGSLLFLASVSRPDISFAVNLVCRYVNNPSIEHVKAVKRILRYLIATKHIGIEYKGNSDLVGYCDSDYASDTESRKSTSGYIFLMNNGPIIWASRKQQTIALSTMEAEFMAACEATKQFLWIRQLLIDLGESLNNMTLLVDNQAAIKLISNPVLHQRSKHIDVKYKFIREKVEQGLLKVQYVQSSNQLADFLTKALPLQKFCVNRDLVLC